MPQSYELGHFFHFKKCAKKRVSGDTLQGSQAFAWFYCSQFRVIIEGGIYQLPAIFVFYRLGLVTRWKVCAVLFFYPDVLHGGHNLLAFRTHGEINKCPCVAAGASLGDYIVVLVKIVFGRESLFIRQVAIYS